MATPVWIQRSLQEAIPSQWLAGTAPIPFDGPSLPPLGDPRVAGLAVRSTARVRDADLARLPALRVVATASSGTDHLDQDAVTSRGLRLVTGRGGNAEAVADWVEWALARVLTSGLQGRRVVVVGVGAVGERVVSRLRAGGARVVAVDPPRAARDPSFSGVTLQQALQSPCAALTLHVPLTAHGEHATAGLIGSAALRRLTGAAVLNAARGGVLDEASALQARSAGRLKGLCIDTFVGEPGPSPEVARGCDLATPHIAGHSREGRLRVAWMAVDGLRRELGLPGLPDLRACIVRLRRQPPLASDAARPFAALDQTHRDFLADLDRLDFSAVRAAHDRLEIAASF